MEADVWIGSKENAHVISTDSDYLFHKNVVALHRFKLATLSKFVSITTTRKLDILAKLKLTGLQWTLLGIVNRNDYDSNVIGYGLVKNLKVIRQLKATSLEMLSLEMLSLEMLLENYCKELSLDSNFFKNSLSIFDKQKVIDLIYTNS